MCRHKLNISASHCYSAVLPHTEFKLSLIVEKFSVLIISFFLHHRRMTINFFSPFSLFVFAFQLLKRIPSSAAIAYVVETVKSNYFLLLFTTHRAFAPSTACELNNFILFHSGVKTLELCCFKVMNSALISYDNNCNYFTTIWLKLSLKVWRDVSPSFSLVDLIGVSLFLNPLNCQLS